MINAHHHLYSALAVGMPLPKNNPTNFTEILQEVWWKMDLALDRDSTQACFEAGLLDSLKAGTTTIIDHHCSPSFIKGSLSLLAETGEKLGLNTSVAFEISDRNGEEKFEASLQENLDTVRKFSSTPHVHPMLGLHASFTLTDASLKKIGKLQMVWIRGEFTHMFLKTLPMKQMQHKKATALFWKGWRNSI